VSITITFLGAAGTVTGSKHLVEIDGRRVLVDCGLYQGLKELRLRNWEPLPVAAASLDWVVLSHAHIDHSGHLPRLINDGFHGAISATSATADLVRILLPDSGRLHEEEASYHNRRGTSKHRPALPLYTAEQGLAAAELVKGVGYQAPISLVEGVTVSFVRAGHILGSASVSMELAVGSGQRRIVFSGDLGRYDVPILPDPAPIGDADYVVVESTYGDRRHSREPIADQLERVIRSTVARGGAIVVPAFAIGRTQELMYHLAGLERAGRIPKLPTYIDSPMAITATEVYCRHPEEFDEDMRAMVMNRDCPLECADVQLTRTSEESRAINAVKGAALIISASGMATGGRVLHHLKQRLPDPRTTVLLVGYQALGTRGWHLQKGATALRVFGEDIPVRARVETIRGLSAHADSDGLMRWLQTASRPPKRTFVVHGDPVPAQALATRIQKELGWVVSVPAYRDRVVTQ
jgi:metallo-beta-lactamase family protein